MIRNSLQAFIDGQRYKINNRNAEIAAIPSVCKKHMTAYNTEIQGLGRARFFGYGLKLINQRIRPYRIQISSKPATFRYPGSIQHTAKSAQSKGSISNLKCYSFVLSRVYF